MNNTKTIRCSCYHELLHLDWDEELQLLDMSVWKPYSTDCKLSWRQRLRYCWQILVGGRPYGDQVVLEKQQIADLVDYLMSVQNK